MMFTGLLMWFSGILRTISRTSVIFVHGYLTLSILCRWKIGPAS